MMGNARVMLVSFEITLQDVTGTMGIYIPFSMLKPVANVLNPHAWIAGLEERRTDDGVRQLTAQGLQQVYVPLRVMLGSAELTCGELLNLRPGDVIPLGTPLGKHLPINVGNRPHFEGQIGTVGQRLAIQITSMTAADTGDFPQIGP
jgi:flagellar motor switch protein FliM